MLVGCWWGVDEVDPESGNLTRWPREMALGEKGEGRRGRSLRGELRVET